MATAALLRGARLAVAEGGLPAQLRAAAGVGQSRSIGNFGVPEHWGKKSKYTEGTDFLGTPADHLELTKKRPLSPDLFKVGTTATPHYKMPPAAISSIVNRVTGLAMTGGMTGLAVVALAGDPVAAIEAFKAGYPALVLPAKAGIAFPMVYHLLGGCRHLFWDMYKVGNQVDPSFLDKQAVEKSSYMLFGASIAGSLYIALA